MRRSKYSWVGTSMTLSRERMSDFTKYFTVNQGSKTIFRERE